jgi:type II secretory pathway pseudopilin PulG
MRESARAERGFALPAVIFLVALLTLLLTSGLSRVQADRQIAEAGEATADAFAVAQSGLQNYVGSQTSRPPDGDSVRINLTGGYANVISRVIRNPADTTENFLYLVRSTGFVINPLAGSAIQAQRTVAQFADWQTGSIERRAAFTAANGLRRETADGEPRSISGLDACGVEPAIPGVLADTVTGDPDAVALDGAPALIMQGSGAGPVVAFDTEIDWARATSAAFVPDYTTFRNGDILGYSIQRVPGSLQLNGAYAGSGIFIVPGNLDINSGTFYFDGIIMVGGELELDAETIIIDGLVYSGLDEQLSTNPARSEIDTEVNWFLRIRFHSCKVNQALAALTGLAPVPNAWQDSWARY